MNLQFLGSSLKKLKRMCTNLVYLKLKPDVLILKCQIAFVEFLLFIFKIQYNVCVFYNQVSPVMWTEP